MIIGNDVILEVADFVAGVQRAARGVRLISVRALGSTSAVGTGWLITPDLVVVPGFVSRPDFQGQGEQTFTCQVDAGPDHPSDAVPATLVSGPPGEQTAPVLLRLARRYDGDELPIAADATAPGDQVVLIHHPKGAPAAHVSFGRIVAVRDGTVLHDASTEGGSSGAPVLDRHFRVIGMHIGKGDVTDPNRSVNQASTAAAILDGLKGTDQWPEIAATHRLVDVGASLREVAAPPPAPSEAPDAELLPAAVRWQFRPDDFPEPVAARLRALVMSPNAPTWVLKPAERQRLLRAAGGLAALRRARGSTPTDHAGQAVIDRILQGPPYPIDEVGDDDLPYWLQAVRWFAGVAPELPTAADINENLERRRVRGRLTEVVSGFRGRSAELDAMSSWYATGSGPLAVSGVGGIGKSALVASFALRLDPDTPLLWLDFDRVDLSADDPASVVRALYEQVAAQDAEVRVPTVSSTDWEPSLVDLGVRLSGSAADPLIVLDGFEIAQHSTQHRQLWQVLEVLAAHAPRVRVLVSGRAPITDLRLGDRPATPLQIHGLDQKSAESWLRDSGIDDPVVLGDTLAITRRVPLSIRLALRLVEQGVPVQDLPAELPEHLVDGYLYRRILDRVVDPELKPIAQDALVLRRLDRAMLESILADRIPPGRSAGETFAGLRQEYALIGNPPSAADVAPSGADVIVLRPEVRQATLRLLEIEDAERVREIDRRAADWYRGRLDGLDDQSRAELIYHLVRLGELDTAQGAWRDGCARFLVDADQDLPGEADQARTWLRERTHVAEGDLVSIEVWEGDAADRIRDLLARGHLPAVREILNERTPRSPASPIVLYDAWMAWQDGQPDLAAALLDAAGVDDPVAGGPVVRDRIVLRAALIDARRAALLDVGAPVDRESDEVDRLLASVRDPGLWVGEPASGPIALAVTAARIRLTVDLAAEELLARTSTDADAARTIISDLPATDVVLPRLLDRLAPAMVYESIGESLEVPEKPWDETRFLMAVDDARRRSVEWDRGGFASILDADPAMPGGGRDGSSAGVESGEELPGLARRVARAGWRRWRLIMDSSLLFEAPGLVDEKSTMLERSVVGVLGVLPDAGRGYLDLAHPVEGSFDRIVERALGVNGWGSDLPSRVADELTGDGPNRGPRNWPMSRDLAGELRQSFLAGRTVDLRGFGLLLLSPDPLTELLRAVLGLPENYTMGDS